VNDWGHAFLGVIAVSTALMAVMQIGAIVVLVRVAGQVRDIVATLQKDIRPLIGRANQIADEASRTATLATAQAEKIDRMVTDLTRRVDETSAVVQQAIITPAREGMAIVAALKAGFGALKGMRDMRGRPGGVDEEDALFIG
jgi:KaiC/GvpD/RAD55 family RecA-like ATPase